MARVTVEDCVDKVENRFELVLLASHRARMISSGAPLTVDRDNDKNPVVALREIADQTVAPGGPQGRPHPFAAEIRRGGRAGAGGGADDRLDGADRRPATTATSPSTACRRRNCCAGWKAWFRRTRPRNSEPAEGVPRGSGT